MKRLVASVVLACSLLLPALGRADVVNVYTSANFAPLMMTDGRGVYPELIEHLNRQKLGHTFRLLYLPRKRLQLRLEVGSLDGLVIGLMPAWLDDPEQKKYLWSAPFATERFVLVSLRARPVHPGRPQTLAGVTVGTTQGYVYPGIDHWLGSVGAHRSDGVSDEKNLDKLLLERVDSVIVADSMARYFIKTKQLHPALQVVVLPGSLVERHFLAPHSQAAVFQQVAPAIRKLRDDPDWRRVAASYR